MTTTVIEWLPVFTEPGLSEKSLYLLEDIRREIGLAVFAFVLMPSHFHGIILAKHRNDISNFMLRWKSLSARLILKYALEYKPQWIGLFKQNAKENKLAGKQEHKVWMTRFDAIPLADDKQYHAAMNYIHSNPVRELMVSEPGEYCYGSASDYQGRDNGFVTVNRFAGGRGQGKP